MKLAPRAMLLFVAAILLMALSGGVWRSQFESRRSLEDRFDTRTELAARFTGQFVEDILAREKAAASALMSGEVSPESFSQHVTALGFQAAVLLDSEGRLLFVHPPRPALIGKDMTQEYPHLRRAVKEGVPAISPVVLSAAARLPLVGFAVPFETASSKRVFSGGFYLSEGLLAQFLRESLPFRRSTVVLIDEAGTIVASNLAESSTKDLAAIDRSLADAASTRDFGRYRRGQEEMYFSAHNVGPAKWRVVAAVPLRTLWEPVAGATTWVPWLILVLLAISAVMAASAISNVVEARAELEVANENLHRANSLINEFVGIASHDLRSPLTTILAYASMLARDEGKLAPDQRQEFATDIERSANHMKRMTDDLLALSALESDGLKPRPESLDLQALVQERIRESALGSQASVEVPPDTRMFADPDHLRRILDNYLTNAKKYGTPPVTVEATMTAEGEVELRIKDSGPGVPVELRDDLFGKFGSACRLSGSKKESTGLGLSIVKALAEANGGTAWYESTEASASCFAVRLPSVGPAS